MNPTEALGHFGHFCFQVVWRCCTPKIFIRYTADHTWEVVTRCVLPVLFVVFPFGMVMSLQGLSIFSMFGAERFLSSLVGVTIFRELAPVLASVLVASQAGSAFAAQLGTMRIQEELDATEVMALDAIRIHVVPRILAVCLAAPILNVFASFAGILGSYTTAVLIKGETSAIFWASLWSYTQFSDIGGGLIKTTVFGAIIGFTGCYQGFYASGGAEGVGRAVNQTVVYSITAFVVANYFLTSTLFGAAP